MRNSTDAARLLQRYDVRKYLLGPALAVVHLDNELATW